jgi:hypothetical protein
MKITLSKQVELLSANLQFASRGNYEKPMENGETAYYRELLVLNTIEDLNNSSILGFDLGVDGIKVYRNNVESFSFKETYSDFALVSNGVDAAGNYAYYVIEDKVEEGLFSVEVRLSINSSASDAVECLRNFISSTTSMTIYPSTAIGIYVGDLLVQGEQNGSFI